MAKGAYKAFEYVADGRYDTEVTVNREKVGAFSTKRLDELNPDGWEVAGETWEGKKRDKDADVGRIELADKILYVSPAGTHEGLLRKKDAVVRTDGGYVALLKPNFAPLIALIAAILVVVGIAVAVMNMPHPSETVSDVNAVLRIYGDVDKEGVTAQGAKLSAQQSGAQKYSTSSGTDGSYEIKPVESGRYSVVASYGDSILTKPAEPIDSDAEVDFSFPENIVKALLVLKADDGGTPPNVTVAGLAEEAIDRSNGTQAHELDLTMTVTRKAEDKVDVQARDAINALKGDLEMTWYDTALHQDVVSGSGLTDSADLAKSDRVFEVAVPYDSTRATGTYVFRYLDGSAQRLEALGSRPTSGFQDGTYFVGVDTVYIYMDRFCTYAIGSVDAGGQTMGTDMIVYSDGATVNLADRTVSLYYRHDKSSTNDARVELYLKGRNGSDVLLGKSGAVAPGKEVSSVVLSADASVLPTSDSYEGTMRIVYLGTDGEVATNVEIPVTITFG